MPYSYESKQSDDCVRNSLYSGIWSGLQAGVVSGGLYHLALRYSPYFRDGFNASARTALFIMPVFYTGWLTVELSMHKCMSGHSTQYESMQDDNDE